MTRRTDKLYQTPRVIHRSVRLTPAGSAGSASAGAFIPLPPGRVTHVAVDHIGTTPATADITLKADGLSDGSTGTAFFTSTDSGTDIPAKPIGSPAAVDEGRAVTAATDGVEGGRFVKTGVHVGIAQSNPNEVVVVDIWLEALRYEAIDLIAQSGADGTGAVTRTVGFNGAGNLIGLELDFQNTPATADVVIKADDTNGQTLFTSTNSLTDFGPVGLGHAGGDEANAATAATDAQGGGAVFKRGLFFSVAESDIFTSGNEKIVAHVWVRQ